VVGGQPQEAGGGTPASAAVRSLDQQNCIDTAVRRQEFSAKSFLNRLLNKTRGEKNKLNESQLAHSHPLLQRTGLQN